MDRRIRELALALALASAACRADGGQPGDAPCAPAAEVEGLRLDQLQVIGTHNSYRRRTYAPILAFVRHMAFSLSGEIEPDGWDYDRSPISWSWARAASRSICGPIPTGAASPTARGCASSASR